MVGDVVYEDIWTLSEFFTCNLLMSMVVAFDCGEWN